LKKQSPVKASLIPSEVRLIAKDDRLGIIHCTDGYEGIGIKRNFGGVVTEVSYGWPAYKAGIQVGDVMTPWDLEPVNGYMEFNITRGDKTFPMRLKTEWICARK
jgi:C-terminal processing protease CtpA/Prc